MTRGERMIAFLETLRVPEGMHAGSPLVLRPWQRDIVRAVYDPVDMEGHRMCRMAVYSVAKKNGKSPLVAGLCLGHLCGPEAILNGQCYSAAFERDQAAIIFKYAWQMVQMDEELSKRLIVRATRREIEDPVSGSVFKALSSEARSKHGLGPNFLIFDELAQFGADREFYDTLIQGRGAHTEPLAWVISTQARDDKAILSELIDYGQAVNAGEIEDPTFRCFLFETPTDADPFDPENWKSSNPALGDFLSMADMQEQSSRAKAMPSGANSFRNLRLNQRVDASNPAISREVWIANGGAPDLALFADGRPVFAGLDLSSKNDLTAMEFVTFEGQEAHVYSEFWSPAEGIRERQDRDKIPYMTWRDCGHLKATPGKTVNYRAVAQRIRELRDDWNICLVMFDRWKIDDFIRCCEEEEMSCVVAKFIEDKEKHTVNLEIPEGYTGKELVLVAHGQGFKDIGPAVTVLEDALIEGNIRHGMHPVLTSCAAAARYETDAANNRKFDKKRATSRIDGIVALAMAMNGAAKYSTARPHEISQGFIDLEG